jgi:hypothetical protein
VTECQRACYDFYLRNALRRLRSTRNGDTLRIFDQETTNAPVDHPFDLNLPIWVCRLREAWQESYPTLCTAVDNQEEVVTTLNATERVVRFLYMPEIDREGFAEKLTSAMNLCKCLRAMQHLVNITEIRHDFDANELKIDSNNFTIVVGNQRRHFWWPEPKNEMDTPAWTKKGQGESKFRRPKKEPRFVRPSVQRSKDST